MLIDVPKDVQIAKCEYSPEAPVEKDTPFAAKDVRIEEASAISAIPTDHPRFLGMQGMHGHYASSMSMHNADVIISLGVRFNGRVTGNRSKFAVKAKVVHIDADGSELNKTVNSVCGLRGDVKLTLEKLLPLLKEEAKPEWMAKVNVFRKEEERYLDHRAGLTPHRAIMTVNKYLGENTAVCTDVGQHQMWAAQSLHFKTARLLK